MEYNYLIVDAYLNGTGVRDKYNEGYLDLEHLNISTELVSEIKNWLSTYWEEYYRGYNDSARLRELDKIGKALALRLQRELPHAKVEYFSDVEMKLYLSEEL